MLSDTYSSDAASEYVRCSASFASTRISASVKGCTRLTVAAGARAARSCASRCGRDQRGESLGAADTGPGSSSRARRAGAQCPRRSGRSPSRCAAPSALPDEVGCVRRRPHEREVGAQQLKLDVRPRASSRRPGRHAARVPPRRGSLGRGRGSPPPRCADPPAAVARRAACTSEVAERQAEASFELVGVGEQT